jgi:hypothetical protein
MCGERKEREKQRTEMIEPQEQGELKDTKVMQLLLVGTNLATDKALNIGKEALWAV